jgi:hypothetical protein
VSVTVMNTEKGMVSVTVCVTVMVSWVAREGAASLKLEIVAEGVLMASDENIAGRAMLENKGRNEHYLSICITNRGLVRSIMRYHGGRTIFVELKERTIGFASCP